MLNAFNKVLEINGVRHKILLVGSGGRECAFAVRLAEDARVYAVMGHENPLIKQLAEQSGGKWTVGNPDDPESVLDFAKLHKVDYAFVSADQPLANGVVDVLLGHGFKCIGATKAASRIEWDKAHAMDVMRKHCPEAMPFFRAVSGAGQIDHALSDFKERNMQVVVKPQGLTGGKGVKVMPEHLETYGDCAAYAAELLECRPGEKVLFVEKLHGIEFTIMGITDGKVLVLSPASYDYPFRHEGDTGPGTGGMGCFTDSGANLPFMSDGDLESCRGIMQKAIDAMERDGTPFNGVLNGGFFKTKSGIKIMEFNGRFGDPEALNILSILRGSFSKLLVSMWDGTLSEDAVKFAGQASVVKYMVAREYPETSPEPTRFMIDEDAVNASGVNLFFASCVQTAPHHYETLKKSRVVAFGALADTIEDASSLVDRAIRNYFRGCLECRRDIGTREHLDKLERSVRL